MKLDMALFRSLVPMVTVLALAGAANAAAPVYMTMDRSNELLIDHATAETVMKAAIPARLVKLYPPKRWGFITVVSGGFNAAKICVVTAHASMVPLSGKTLVYKPTESAAAFDALPNATQEQCKELAKTKLKEAADGVFVSLVSP